jgi:hypothetical protein
MRYGKVGVVVLAAIISSLSLLGCNKWFWGGAAAGAAGTGAAYEYQKKEQMDKLDEQFERGEITAEEYLRRKKEIEEGSIIY